MRQATTAPIRRIRVSTLRSTTAAAPLVVLLDCAALPSAPATGLASRQQTVTADSARTHRAPDQGALCSAHGPGSCPAQRTGVHVVCADATSGDGTSERPWSGWEAGINALAARAVANDLSNTPISPGAEIYFPAGYYRMSARVDLRPGWTVRGAGVDSTQIAAHPGFDADAFRLGLKINGSNRADLRVEDLTILNPGPAGLTSAAVDVIGGTYVSLSRVKSYGFPYAVIFDQAEVATIRECNLGGTVGAIWLVDGPEHTPGASAGFTNVISVRDSQIAPMSPTAYGIIDDGGYSHTIDGCNFVGGGTLLRSACTVVSMIANSYFEGASATDITTAQTTLSGIPCGGDSNLTILGNQLVSNDHAAIALGSPYQVFMANNFLNSTTTAVIGVSTVGSMVAILNAQHGTGALFDATPTNGAFANGPGLGVGVSTPTQALEVNGGARLNTAAERPPCAPGTRGLFWVLQGPVGVKDQVSVCAKDARDAYTWRSIY
jgi:hypothetical protein